MSWYDGLPRSVRDRLKESACHPNFVRDLFHAYHFDEPLEHILQKIEKRDRDRHVEMLNAGIDRTDRTGTNNR